MSNEQFEMNEEELIEFEKDFARFSEIQEQNNFKTIWSIYEVKDMNEISPFQAECLTDGCNNVEVKLPNKKLTWLELWKYTDMLYETTGDAEHLFIESFEVKKSKNTKKLEVFLGS
jgi:hypothetical protein